MFAAAASTHMKKVQWSYDLASCACVCVCIYQSRKGICLSNSSQVIRRSTSLKDELWRYESQANINCSIHHLPRWLAGRGMAEIFRHGYCGGKRESIYLLFCRRHIYCISYLSVCLSVHLSVCVYVGAMRETRMS